MKSIRIENLRSLADTGFIDLKPITLLLGENDSGKSTFLRTFPLFHQSVESRTTGPILWYGQFVDFGSFQEALRRKTKEQHIAFHFRFHLSPRRTMRFLRSHNMRRYSSVFLEDLDVTLTLKISEAPKRGGSYAIECLLAFAEHTIRIVLDREGKVTKFVVNSCDLSTASGDLRNIQRIGLVPRLAEVTKSKSEPRDLSSLFKLLVNEVSQYVHQNTLENTIIELAWGFGIGSSDSMLHAIQSSTALAVWKKKTLQWTTDNKSFRRVRDLVIAANITELLSASEEYITSFATNSNYVPPLRATAERYYRLQNLAVDEVDFQGKNLAMFLWSLTETERKRFSAWTEKYFGFTSSARASGGHVSLNLKEHGVSDEFNLADKGFGFSQILPILTQLWALSYRGGRRLSPSRIARRRSSVLIVAIEQPELHLHPRLQAKLMDSFIDVIEAARKINIELKLIIETHSETMVNRLGHRVANHDIEPQDINIVIFEKKQTDASTQVYIGEYDQEGFLTNWPFGFFEPDEVK